MSFVWILLSIVVMVLEWLMIKVTVVFVLVMVVTMMLVVVIFVLVMHNGDVFRCYAGFEFIVSV